MDGKQAIICASFFEWPENFSDMAVLKKFRPRWWLNGRQSPEIEGRTNIALVPPVNARYDVRPLTVSQIDECWRLDQRCFVDGEAYSRDTFDYLLTAPESVSYRVWICCEMISAAFAGSTPRLRKISAGTSFRSVKSVVNRS